MGRPIPRPEQGSDDDEAAFSSRLFTIAQPSDPNASQSLQGLFCSTVGCKDDDSSSEDGDLNFAFCSMMGEDDAARHLEYAFLVPAARSPSKWPILLWIHGGDFETRGALAPVALPAVILDALRCGELAVALLTHRLADDADGEWPAPWDDLPGPASRDRDDGRRRPGKRRTIVGWTRSSTCAASPRPTTATRTGSSPRAPGPAQGRKRE